MFSIILALIMMSLTALLSIVLLTIITFAAIPAITFILFKFFPSERRFLLLKRFNHIFFRVSSLSYNDDSSGYLHDSILIDSLLKRDLSSCAYMFPDKITPEETIIVYSNLLSFNLESLNRKDSLQEREDIILRTIHSNRVKIALSITGIYSNIVSGEIDKAPYTYYSPSYQIVSSLKNKLNKLISLRYESNNRLFIQEIYNAIYRPTKNVSSYGKGYDWLEYVPKFDLPDGILYELTYLRGENFTDCLEDSQIDWILSKYLGEETVSLPIEWKVQLIETNLSEFMEQYLSENPWMELPKLEVAT